MYLPSFGGWDLSQLVQNLPWPAQQAGEPAEAALPPVLFKLPPYPLPEAQQLRKAESAELSGMRDDARKQGLELEATFEAKITL